jgi:hypothetical protein
VTAQASSLETRLISLFQNLSKLFYDGGGMNSTNESGIVSAFVKCRGLKNITLKTSFNSCRLSVACPLSD